VVKEEEEEREVWNIKTRESGKKPEKKTAEEEGRRRNAIKEKKGRREKERKEKKKKKKERRKGRKVALERLKVKQHRNMAKYWNMQLDMSSSELWGRNNVSLVCRPVYLLTITALDTMTFVYEVVKSPLGFLLLRSLLSIWREII
jgi:hypothetical protein